MQYLDHVKLQAVLDGFQKKAFVPMPGGAAPVAGAGPMTDGMAAPMQDPAAMAGGGMPPVDPAAGMPMDLAMMGADPAAAGGAMPPVDPATGMPMDPAAMGGMPPMDPAMPGAPPAGTVTMSIPELIQLIEVVKGGGPAKPGSDPVAAGGEEGGVPGEAKPKKSGGTAAINEKLDALLGALGMGGGMPPPAAPMPGM